MAFLDNISLKNGSNSVGADRYAGGQGRTESDHPFTKGYFYVFFGLPSQLFGSGSINNTAAKDYLLSSAEAFTPHADRQIMTQDTQGMGGAGGASFIVGQQISREFNIQYKDYWGSPVMRIHRNWTGYLDPYLGVSIKADNFGASEYKGTCMVIQTKPVARKVGKDQKEWKPADILKVYFYDGVQCLTDFNSVYDSNIAENSFVKPTAQYKFDGYPLTELDPEVLESAVTVLNNASIFTKTIEVYNKLVSDTNVGNGMTPSLN